LFQFVAAPQQAARPGDGPGFFIGRRFGWISAMQVCGIPDVRKDAAFLVARFFKKSFEISSLSLSPALARCLHTGLPKQ